MKLFASVSGLCRGSLSWLENFTKKNPFGGGILASLAAALIISPLGWFWPSAETLDTQAQTNSESENSELGSTQDYDVAPSIPPVWMAEAHMNGSGLGKSPEEKETADIARRAEHRASSVWPIYDDEKFADFLFRNKGLLVPARLPGEDYRDPSIQELNRLVGEWCDTENGKYLTAKPTMRGLELSIAYTIPQITGVKITNSVWPIANYTKSKITYALPNFSAWETGAYAEIYHDDSRLALHRRFEDNDGWHQSRGIELYKCPKS